MSFITIFRGTLVVIIVILTGVATTAIFRDDNMALGIALISIAGLSFGALVTDQLERELRSLRRRVIRLEQEKRDESDC